MPQMMSWLLFRQIAEWTPERANREREAFIANNWSAYESRERNPFLPDPHVMISSTMS